MRDDPVTRAEVAAFLASKRFPDWTTDENLRRVGRALEVAFGERDFDEGAADLFETRYPKVARYVSWHGWPHERTGG